MIVVDYKVDRLLNSLYGLWSSMKITLIPVHQFKMYSLFNVSEPFSRPKNFDKGFIEAGLKGRWQRGRCVCYGYACLCLYAAMECVMSSGLPIMYNILWSKLHNNGTVFKPIARLLQCLWMLCTIQKVDIQNKIQIETICLPMYHEHFLFFGFHRGTRFVWY